MKRKSLVALMLMLVMAISLMAVGCGTLEAPAVETIDVEFAKDATLESVPLSLGFSWKDKDEALKYGEHKYVAIYEENGKSIETRIAVNVKPSATMVEEEESMDYVEKQLMSDAYKKGGAMYENTLYDKYVMILARSYRGVKADIKAAYMARVKDLMATEGYLDKTNNKLTNKDKSDMTTSTVMTLIALKENVVVDGVDLAAPFYTKAFVEDNVYGGFSYKMRVVKNITIPASYKTADGVEHTSDVTNDGMVEYVVGLANVNGGWYMEDYYSGELVLDIDTTINTILGLAEYYDRAEVKAVVDKAVEIVKAKVIASGSVDNWGNNISTTAAMISAASAIGIDPTSVKNAESSKSLLDFAKTQRITEGVAKGAYTSGYPDAEGNASTFANNDMFTALVSYNRYLRGEANFFDVFVK